MPSKSARSVVLERPLPIGRPRKTAPQKPNRPTPYEQENMRYFAQLRGEPEPLECRLVECDACEGHGTTACYGCDGDGTVDCFCSECDDRHSTTCDDCSGKGHLGQCPKCMGEGEVDGEDDEQPAPKVKSLPLPYCYWITR